MQIRTMSQETKFCAGFLNLVLNTQWVQECVRYELILRARENLNPNDVQFSSFISEFSNVAEG